MATEHPLRDLLHGATHRIPGVPAHVEHAAGHQGPANQGPANRGLAAPDRATRDEAPHADPARPAGRVAASERSPHPSRGRSRNHTPGRPPRVMVAWQHRIARFFGQDV